MDRLTAWLRTEPDRAAGWTLVAIGAQLVLVTYLSIDSEPTIVSQLAFLVSGGLGGLLVLGVGLATLVLADLADEWHKLDRIEAALDRRPPPARAHLSALRRPIVAGLVGLAVAVVVLLVAWNRAADATDPGDGFRAVGLGIAGLITGGASLAAATFLFLRVVRLRSSRLFAPWLLQDLQARSLAGGYARTDSLGPSPAPALPATVLVGAGLQRFHAPGCAVVAAGGPYETVAFAAVPPGLSPCGLCLPDLPPAGPGTALLVESATFEGATSR